MSNELLNVKAKCQGNDACVFEGRDIFLDIQITNTGTTAVGFPLEFLQKVGPVIRLIDTRTKADTYLKTNLADLDLREKYTFIGPGKSVTLEWVITSDELRQFGSRNVDVSAEITLNTEVLVDGKKVDFRSTDTVRIAGKDKA